MIKLSFIVPTAFIDQFGNQGDFHLALSHLIDFEDQNQYETKLVQSKKEIYLDNGCFENGVPEDPISLIKKAARIGATYFFAPDTLYDAEANKQSLNKTIELLREIENQELYRFNKTLKVGAVVQADNEDDYIKQLIEFNQDQNIDLIGLSILSIPKSFQHSLGRFDITASRIELLRQMNILATQKNIKWKDCHLLGLGNSMADVMYANQWCPFVKSNDSSCCFQSGLFGKQLINNLEVPGGKVEQKIDFNLKTITNNQSQLIQQNIGFVKQTLKTI